MPAAPVTVYIGLFTTLPADTGTTGGTADGVEMTTSNGALGFSNYARVPLTAATGWSAIAAASGDSSGQQISNNAVLPASGLAWTNNGGTTVTVAGLGIYSAATAGNLYAYIPLSVAQPVTNGASFSQAVAGLSLQVD